MNELENMVIRLLGDGKSYQQMITEAVGSTATLSKAVGVNSSQIGALTRSLGSFASQANSIIGMLTSSLGIGSALGTIQSAIFKAAETEQIEIAFRSLIGDAQLAQKTLADLREFAVVTPFELPQILEAAKSMLAYGQSAETIVPTMQRLGDVASALNIPLSSLTYLYGTLKSSGRVMTVDMRQFANRGIPIWLELAKVIGMVSKDTRELTGAQSTQLQQMVSKGKVTFEMIEKAFISMTSEGGRFFDMMKDQSASFNGIISNLKDSLGLLLADIGKQIIEGFDLKRITGEVRDFATWAANAFKNMDPEMKKFLFTIVGVTAGFGVLLSAVLAVKAAIFTVGAIVATIGLPFLAVITAIVTATALWVHEMGGIGKAIDVAKQNAEEFWEWLLPVREALGSLWDTIVINSKSAWEMVKKWATEAWESMKERFNVNWEDVREGFVTGIFFIEYTLKNFEQVWDAAWKGMKYYAIKALNDVLANIFFILGAPVIGAIAVLYFNWTTVWGLMYDAAIGYMRGLGGAIRTIVENLGSIIKGEFDWSTILKPAFGEINGLRLPSGIEIPALKELEDQWRKEWEQASQGVKVGFDDFKAQRERELRWARKATSPAGEDPLKDHKKLIDETAKSYGKAAKEVHNFEQVLIGSTESYARILEYRERLFGLGAVKKMVEAAKVPETTTVQTHGGDFVDIPTHEPVGTGAVAGEKQETVRDVLVEIRDILKSQKNAPRIELFEAGFSEK